MTGLVDAGASLVKEFREIVTRHFISITLFVGIVGLLLLQLPKSVVDIFYIDDFRTANSELIGVVSFVALAMAFFALLCKIMMCIVAQIQDKRRSVKDERRSAKKQQKRIELLRSLTLPEYTFLSQYTRDRTQVIQSNVDNPIARGLVRKEILHLSSLVDPDLSRSRRIHSQRIDYHLHSWAYDYLCENLEEIMRKLEHPPNSLPGD